MLDTLSAKFCLLTVIVQKRLKHNSEKGSVTCKLCRTKILKLNGYPHKPLVLLLGSSGAHH